MSEAVALTENDIYERMVATLLDHRLPPGTKLIEDITAAAKHQTLGRILRELVSRTSLILKTYSASRLQARSDATSCGCSEHLEQLESQLRFDEPDSEVPDLLSLFATADA